MLAPADEPLDLRPWRVRLADRFTAKSARLSSQGKPKRAIHALHAAAFLHPVSQRWLNLASLFCEQGRASKGAIPIAMALGSPDGNIPLEVLTYKAIVECALGNLEAAERWLRLANLRAPDDASAIYALASVLCAQGRIAEADELFKRDVPVMTGTGQPTYTRVLLFEGDAGAQPRPLTREFQGLPDAFENTGQALFFAAADSVYFCRYARQVAASIAKATGGSAALHLHVVNPNEAAKALSAEISRLPGVSVSSERVDIEGLDESEQKTYYACARYRLLPEVMGRTEHPVVTVDIDQLVMKDPTPLFRMAEGHDVALLRFPGSEFNVLSVISATLMVLSPTEEGRRFAEKLRGNIEHALATPGRLLWHLDQAALAKSYFSKPGIKCTTIPRHMLHLADGEPGEQAIFWSITNSITANEKKLDAPSFKKHEAPPGATRLR